MQHEKTRRKLQRKLQIYEECDSEKMHGFVVFDIVSICFSGSLKPNYSKY